MGHWGTGLAKLGSSTGHCDVSLWRGNSNIGCFRSILCNKRHLQSYKSGCFLSLCLCVLSSYKDIRILSEELSVWAGELDTLLLRWDEGWLPGLLLSSKDGAGDGLSGTRSWKPCNHKSTQTK